MYIYIYIYAWRDSRYEYSNNYVKNNCFMLVRLSFINFIFIQDWTYLIKNIPNLYTACLLESGYLDIEFW